MPTMAKSTPYLPLSEYITLQFLHGAWLVFSFAWLPRSKSLFTTSSPSIQTSSADRPEHPLLTPITSNVTLTLACSAAGAAFISVWWAAHLRHWHEGRSGPHASEDAQLEGEDELKQRQNQFSGKLTRIKNAVLATLGSAVVVTVVLALLGAPVLEAQHKTFLFALHFCFLTVYPFTYTLGVPSLYQDGVFDRYTMTRLVCEFSPETPLERAIVYPVIGTMIGAWVGVAPLALDWDRPWQSYPLTPTFGSIVGHILGGFASYLRSGVEAEEAKASKTAAPTPSATSRKKKGKPSKAKVA